MPKLKTLRPVRANIGIEVAFRRKLLALIDEMNASVLYWLKASYRANEPKIVSLAQDDLPAEAMRRAIRALSKQWLKRFGDGAERLAEYFATAASKRSDAALAKILRDAGFSVKFQMTAAQRDVLQATINESVSLIKSIPAQYLTQVEGAVMRSVQTGRDLKSLTDDLEKNFGVTRRRAAFIARDQNNKATASLNRARQVELGITEAVWMHSGGGKTQRPSHVKAGRERTKFDVRKGLYDHHVKKFILPGELPNCRCVSRSIVPGFS